jgi:hypothetical protein
MGVTKMGLVMPIYFSVFFLIFVIGIILFKINKNMALKRKIFPIWIITTYSILGGLMVWFCISTQGKISAHSIIISLVFVIPATVLIGYLNIKNTKFCDSCGRMLQNPNWFSKMDYCPKCGSKLA